MKLLKVHLTLQHLCFNFIGQFIIRLLITYFFSPGKTKEGVKDSATAGDYRSHRVMYYSLRKTFPKVKVISEEHDPSPDIGNVPVATINNPEVERYMTGDEDVNADDVTVWIGRSLTD